MVNNSTNIGTTQNYLSLPLTEQKKKTATFDIANPGPGLEQTQTCGGIKPINGIVTIASW